MNYPEAVGALEGARDQYLQAVQSLRTWPFVHDAEHQQPSADALQAVADAAIMLGHAQDVRDAAWRAYKKAEARDA